MGSPDAPVSHGWIGRFEKVIIYSLTVLMITTVLFATIELAYLLVRDLLSPPLFLLEIEEMLEVFGWFLMVLLGLELLETIVAYIREHVIHIEVVLVVAIIAVSRKVVILDITKLPPLTLVGIAAIVIALSAGYFLVKRSHAPPGPASP
jgi:uncharacterized membrane protein (DUF373 family)